MQPGQATVVEIFGIAVGIIATAGSLLALRAMSKKYWMPLGDRFASTHTDLRDEKRFCSLSIIISRRVRFNLGCCCAISILNEGLNLRVQFPFGGIFPPVMLTWHAIENVEYSKSVLGVSTAVVSVKDYAPKLIFYYSAALPIYEKWKTRR